MSTDLAYATALELAHRIRRRDLSPVEVMRATLDRAERSQPVLNAFVTLCPEAAMAGARAAERAVMRGDALGLLHGLPLSVKDLVPTAGVRTTYGSLIYRNHVPAQDPVVIQRLKQAGAILFGKTTTPEFGQQPLTRSRVFGETRNAWSATRTAAGSSGGAAAAVAAGIGVLAVASDGGGSTRIPAAANGVVGFKQSLGTVPQDWAHDAFGNISYVTPMTRTVADTALMLSVMAGPSEADPQTIGRPSQDYLAAVQDQHDLKGLRLGFRALLGNTVLGADMRRLFEQAVATLAEAGAELSECTHDVEHVERLWFIVNASYRRAQYGHLIAEHRAIMCPTFLRQMDAAADYSAAELYDGILMRSRLYRQVQGWLEGLDAIVMPTLSRAALPLDQDFFAPIEIDNQVTDTIRRAWYPYTMPFNLTGHPAISVPCGFDSDGLPLGLQILGRPGADATVLRLAAAFEQRRPWAQHRPHLPELDA